MKPSCRARAPGRCTRSASCWWRVILGSLSEGRSGWYYPRGEGDGVARDAGASPAQRPVIETRGCSSPTSIRSRQPSKSGAAGTRACAGRRDARGTARPSCGRLTLPPGRFDKSSCAKLMGISLSSVNGPAVWRSSIDVIRGRLRIDDPISSRVSRCRLQYPLTLACRDKSSRSNAMIESILPAAGFPRFYSPWNPFSPDFRFPRQWIGERNGTGT